MAEPDRILVTGAGGGVGGVGAKGGGVAAGARPRRTSDGAPRRRPWQGPRAARRRRRRRRPDAASRGSDGPGLGAADVLQHGLAPSYLEATIIVATWPVPLANCSALVAISQMTVSQMDALSMSESDDQRLHWLSEQ